MELTPFLRDLPVRLYLVALSKLRCFDGSLEEALAAARTGLPSEGLLAVCGSLCQGDMPFERGR